MILLLLLLQFFSLFFQFEVSGEKILALAFVSGQSYRNAQQDLLVELAKRGHEVTIVNSYKSPKSNSHPNIREINGMTFEDLAKNDKLFNPFEMRLKGKIVNPFNLLPGIQLLCESYYEMPEIKELLKEKFDLIILSAFINECTLAIPVHMKTNFILYSAFGIPSYITGVTGTPSPPSFVPIVWSELTDQMNFFQRISQIWTNGVIRYKYYFQLVPIMETVYRNVFGEDFPSAAEIYKNVSLVISNTHFSINYARPFLPDSIEVAGMHCKDAKPLPKDLEEFVDGGKDGFIFFSMGSVVPAHTMPDEYRKAFLGAFKELKQRVIWKWETEEMKETLPENVKLVKWAPQQDILGHSKIRVFITHGGMLSTQEAVHHGVPLLGLPMFGDQDWNMAMAENGGYAIKMQFTDISKDSVLAVLGKLLNDPKYRNKAKELSSVFRDRERNPLDTAVFWAEYVMRHRGAPQLRSPARDLSFFSYYSIDVLLTFILIASLLITIIFKVIKCIWKMLIRLLFTDKNESKNQKMKKMK